MERTKMMKINYIERKKKIKLFTIFALTFILAMPASAANVTEFEVHGVVFDQNSSIYNTTLEWDAQNFTGFWYASGGGKQSEILTINQLPTSLSASSRIIQEEKLLYYTSRTDSKYNVFSNMNKKVENGLEYNSTTKIITENTSGGYYARLGWFGDVYVAVNGKSNKLAKLLIDIKDKKTLKLGKAWSLGEGYNLIVETIDTKVSPRQAWLSLSKDGKTIDNKVVNEGEVYTYIEKSLKGETDVPVFVTYVDGIFEGNEAFVNLKYTWFISQNVLEIKPGDELGVFEVKEADENHIFLSNKEKISLDQNTVQPLYGNLTLKVADSSTALRFYPFIEKTKPGKYELRGGAYDESKYKILIWDAQRFPGFWYALGGGRTSENLAVDQPASSLTNANRIIEQEKLLYNTSRTDVKFNVFSNINKKVENGLEYNSTTKIFTENTSGGYYARLGWFGNVYVAVNGKSNKLAKLLIDIKDKKTLKLGKAWSLGEGYNLIVESIDTKVSPRQTWVSLSKDGKTIDNRVVNEGEVYTYIEKKLKGETDVPVFVTYVDGIFEGTEAFVNLKYTWFISQNVLEIKPGDELGVFEVKEADENHIFLSNKDKINLGQNTVQPLYGELKFKVADSSTALRFYPIFEHTIQAAPEVNLNASANTTNTTATTPTTTKSTISSSSSIELAAVTTTPSTSSQAASSGVVQDSSPVTKPNETAKPQQWNWIFLAVAGLVSTGYLILRKG